VKAWLAKFRPPTGGHRKTFYTKPVGRARSSHLRSDPAIRGKTLPPNVGAIRSGMESMLRAEGGDRMEMKSIRLRFRLKLLDFFEILFAAFGSKK